MQNELDLRYELLAKLADSIKKSPEKYRELLFDNKNQLLDCVRRPTNLRALGQIFYILGCQACIEVGSLLNRDFILQFFAKPTQVCRFINQYPILSDHLNLKSYLISICKKLEDVITVIKQYPDYATFLFRYETIRNLIKNESDIYDVISICPELSEILMSDDQCVRKSNSSVLIDIIFTNPKIVLTLMNNNHIRDTIVDYFQVMRLIKNFPLCAEEIKSVCRKPQKISINEENVEYSYYDEQGRICMVTRASVEPTLSINAPVMHNNTIYYMSESHHNHLSLVLNCNEVSCEYDALGNIINKTIGFSVLSEANSTHHENESHGRSLVDFFSSNPKYFYAKLIDILFVLSKHIDKLSKKQIKRRDECFVYYYDARGRRISSPDGTYQKNMEQLFKNLLTKLQVESFSISQLEPDQIKLIAEYFDSTSFFDILIKHQKQDLLLKLFPLFHLVATPAQIADYAFFICAYVIDKNHLSCQQTFLGYFNKLFGTYLIPYQPLSIQNVKDIISNLETKKHPCAFLLMGHLLVQATEQQLLEVNLNSLEIMLMDSLRFLSYAFVSNNMLYRQAAAELIWHIDCNYRHQFQSVRNFAIHIQRESGIQIDPTLFCRSTGFIKGQFYLTKNNDNNYRVPVNLLLEHSLFAKSCRDVVKVNQSSVEIKRELIDVYNPLV